MIGSILNDRYQLDQVLGQGGMGVVYRGRDTLLEREVAVKVLSDTGLGAEARARLFQEARAAASLNHPNIVAVYDVGEWTPPSPISPSAGPTSFIVMELVTGQSLRGYRPASLDEMVDIVAQMCAALEQAHDKGIIHRDLKPDNVMLVGEPAGGFGTSRRLESGTSRRLVKLMDFGLARISGGARLTQEGAIMGTLAYMAPELILGRQAGPQSDLYALGVMFYELATGRQPFESNNPAALLTDHLHAPVVPPSAYDGDIPPILDKLIVQLLEKQPQRRPSSAAEVRQILETTVDASTTLSTGSRRSPVDGQSILLPPDHQPPTTTYQLDRLARGRLVGREKELAEATAVWRQTLAGQSQVLLLSGEPGIGKTRLAQALVAQAQLACAQVFSGGCYEYEAAIPYLPVAEALRAWVGDQSAEDLRRHLGNTAAELARLVPEIKDRLGDLEPGPPLSPHEERLRHFDNVARFFAGQAGQRGLILFIDDLHWADSGTLSMLSYMLRRLRDTRLLLLATYREVELDRAHPLADALVQWNRERLSSRITLQRFTIEETNIMIATLFGQQRVSDELAEAMHRETEGNPFFIEEVVKALIEQDQIYREGDRWQRNELSDLAIPQSIKEAIGRRLNRLSDSCIDTLHIAAALGKSFSFSELSAVAAMDEEPLLDALDEALNAQLVRSLSGEELAFTHDKIREVLYEELNPIRRHRLHLRVGQALEILYADNLDAHSQNLAYHFLASGDVEKGLPHSLQAARNAQSLFAGHEAITYYGYARECAEALSDRSAMVEIDEAMGDILSVNGPFPPAIDHYHQALANAGSAGKRATLQVKLGQIYGRTADDRGPELLNQLLDTLDPENQRLERAITLTQLGRYAHYKSQYSQAIAYYEDALQLIETVDDPFTIASAYAYLAGSYQHQGKYEQSLHWARTCIAFGEQNDYPPAVAMGHEFKAENYGLMGLFQDMIEAAEIDFQIGEKIGSVDRLAWASWCLGWAFWGQGRLKKAAKTLAEAVNLAESTGDWRLVSLTSAYLASVQADLGEVQLAKSHAQRSLDEADKLGEPIMRGYARSALGYIHIGLEEWDEAAGWLESGLDLFEGTENGATRLYTGALLAEARLGQSRNRPDLADEAAQIAAEYLILANDSQALLTAARARLVFGLARAAQGKKAEAEDALAHAIASMEKLGSRLQLGRSYYQRALIRRGWGEEDAAAGDLAQAMAIFEACDATPDLHRAQSIR